MKKHHRFLAGITAALAAAFAVSSCAYDPYASSTSIGYSSGYGQGYGYGGSLFSTSVLIGTGNPRWGYDPTCYSYYDYTRRSYYDPYLNGYYPIGYRPPVIYGVSHPYGWRPGSSYCRPPSRVSNVTISNYRNRESSYRNAGYASVRQPATYPGRDYRQGAGSSDFSRNYRQDTVPYDSSRSYRQGQGQPDSSRSYPAQPGSRDRSPSNSYSTLERQRSGTRDDRGGSPQPGTRYPSRSNSPVTNSQPIQGDPRSGAYAARPTQNSVRELAPPDQSRGNRQQTRREGPQEAERGGRPDSDGRDPRGQRAR